MDKRNVGVEGDRSLDCRLVRGRVDVGIDIIMDSDKTLAVDRSKSRCRSFPGLSDGTAMQGKA